MRRPAAVFFDLDDTLICYGGMSAQCWAQVCAEFVEARAPGFSPQALEAEARAAQRWYWGDPRRHERGRMDLGAARREIAAIALTQLGISDPEAARFLGDAYSARHEAATYRFPDAIPALEALRSGGARLALITNGTSQGQRGKIRRFDLEKYFEHILIEQEVGFGKPDLRTYRLALEQMGLDPREVWMVGDNLVWDIQAAQAAGLFAIWRDPRGAGLPADACAVPDGIIRDVGEVAVLYRECGEGELRVKN